MKRRRAQLQKKVHPALPGLWTCLPVGTVGGKAGPDPKQVQLFRGESFSTDASVGRSLSSVMSTTFPKFLEEPNKKHCCSLRSSAFILRNLRPLLQRPDDPSSGR